jgi:transposase
MVSRHMFQRIRELSESGMSIRAIERELKISRKTIAKYLKSNAPPRYKKRQTPTRQDPCVPYMDRIRSLMDRVPNILACDIFILLKEEGYAGSLRTLERRVSRIRSEKPKERFFEQHYKPGEQAQFDFKESIHLPFIYGERLIHLHFGTLPYSGYFAIKAYGHRTYEAFIDGFHSFFESAGGMTDSVRFDNLAPCVRKVLKGDERIYTDRFKKAIDYYGFGTLPCSPGKGNEKGDVEREIRTQARRIIAAVKATGKVFHDYDDLNSWLLQHAEKYRTAATRNLFEEERQHLKPLPPRDVDILCHTETMTASKYGTIRYKKSTYSVPDSMIMTDCRVIAGPYEIRIERPGHEKLYCLHQRKEDGTHSILLEHVLPSLVRKPGAMVRWAHRELLFPEPSFRRYFKWLQKTLPDAEEREYLKSINLIQFVSLKEIGLAMDIVQRNKSRAPFDDLKALLLLTSTPSPTAMDQKPIQTVLSTYDDLIPSNQEISA